MKGINNNAFLLNVDTLPLIEALKLLCKLERQSETLHLRFDAGKLVVSMGKTSQEVPASGTWPHSLPVNRRWAVTLVNHPMGEAITPLRWADGQLSARDFKFSCPLENSTAEGDLVDHNEDLGKVLRILGHCGVTELDIDHLIENGDPAKARLWGPEDSLIDRVSEEWTFLARSGVEPSDIRRLMDSKLQGVWKSGRKRGSLFKVDEEEKRHLVEAGDRAKAKLWQLVDGYWVQIIANAWKRLAKYGVEPSDILQLVISKSRSER